MPQLYFYIDVMLLFTSLRLGQIFSPGEWAICLDGPDVDRKQMSSCQSRFSITSIRSWLGMNVLPYSYSQEERSSRLRHQISPRFVAAICWSRLMFLVAVTVLAHDPPSNKIHRGRTTYTHFGCLRKWELLRIHFACQSVPHSKHLYWTLSI